MNASTKNPTRFQLGQIYATPGTLEIDPSTGCTALPVTEAAIGAACVRKMRRRTIGR